jgi:aspartyl-tRNA(Asn)/glutamyl-tRNA(Gln) amidotransferase subunit A
MPTVAILPPRLAELEDDDAFLATNAAALRNTLIASILDLPAISLPVSRPGDPPVGLMMIGLRGSDLRLLAAAQAVEAALAH